MSCTALACTRKDRPTRTAGSSPLCTSRYTVILETLINAATSATVRNCVLVGWPSAELVSRAVLPPEESRPDGPFVDVIATHSNQARTSQRLPLRWHLYAHTTWRIAGLVGLLRRVGNNLYKFCELLRCNSQLLGPHFAARTAASIVARKPPRSSSRSPAAVVPAGEVTVARS